MIAGAQHRGLALSLGTGPRRWSAALVMAAIAVAGCNEAREPRATPPVAAPALTSVRVAVETVHSEPVEDVIEAVGTVRSRTQAVVSAKIVAAVLAVHVREGDRVRAGQTLITLDDRDIVAQLERARAALREAKSGREEVDRSIEAADRAVDVATAQDELARTTASRSKRLFDQELIAKQDWDEAAARARVASAELLRARQVRESLVARRRQADARIEAADADVRNASVVAGYARIVAPADAIVAARTVEPGNLAAPSTPLLTLEEEHYRLEATVRESDAGRIRLGTGAAVTVAAVPGELAATVVEIVPAADPASRTFTVKLDLPPRAGVRSGLYGQARFPVGRRVVATIPRRAVIQRGQLESVFVIGDDAIARLRLVTTGKRYGERVEILSGLGPDERVAADATRLVEGQPVDVAR